MSVIGEQRLPYSSAHFDSEASAGENGHVTIPDMIHRPTRRSLLSTAAVSVSAAAAANLPGAIVPVQQSPALRFVHMTDMHVQPERGAADGWAMALQSLAKLDPPPAFIVNGGDHVMDANSADAARCHTQWNFYEKAVREQTTPKIHSIIGNHDIFGWGDKNVGPDTAGYGKAMAQDRLGLKTPYYSFDAGGWHFILLDSVTRKADAYSGDIDPAQKEWLKTDLAKNPGNPICVVSHIPILSACVYFAGANVLMDDGWHIPEEWMHRDTWNLLTLFKPPLRVPLFLSGHIHLRDRIEYGPHTFICDGAVCGNWWRGPLQGVPEGYGVIDLYPNGTFTHQYVAYGWTSRE